MPEGRGGRPLGGRATQRRRSRASPRSPPPHPRPRAPTGRPAVRGGGQGGPRATKFCPRARVGRQRLAVEAAEGARARRSATRRCSGSMAPIVLTRSSPRLRADRLRLLVRQVVRRGPARHRLCERSRCWPGRGGCSSRSIAVVVEEGAIASSGRSRCHRTRLNASGRCAGGCAGSGPRSPAGASSSRIRSGLDCLLGAPGKEIVEQAQSSAFDRLAVGTRGPSRPGRCPEHGDKKRRSTGAVDAERQRRSLLRSRFRSYIRIGGIIVAPWSAPDRVVQPTQILHGEEVLRWLLGPAKSPTTPGSATSSARLAIRRPAARDPCGGRARRPRRDRRA